MGERFYQAQAEYKPKRKLKKDYIDFINSLLDVEIEGLDRCTIANLEILGDAIHAKIQGEEFGSKINNCNT